MGGGGWGMGGGGWGVDGELGVHTILKHLAN